MNEEAIGKHVVDTAVQLHKALGPGLLESVYEVLLADQLIERGLQVARQVPIPITFNGKSFTEGFRADLIIEGKVLWELKSIEKVNNAHKKQLLTYLKLTDIKLGYLINFGGELMKGNITRTLNGYL